MYENAVPVFEMKNKLSFFLHKAREEGPVFISNHGKPAFVLQTIEEYEEQNAKGKKEKNIWECIQESRKEYGLEADDFDYTSYFEDIREDYHGREDAEHIFDEV